MRFSVFALMLCVSANLGFAAGGTSIEDQSTHQQSAIVKIADDDNPLKINAFCMDAEGHIVAVCGSGPGEVRIVNDEGEILRSWKVNVRPEAINVASDGSILVGGEGELFRFDREGKVLKTTKSPHAQRLTSDNKEVREQAIAYLKRRSGTSSSSSLEARVATYEQMIKQLEERGAKSELNESEERTLELLPKTLERYKEQLAAQKEKEGDQEEKGPSEEEIDRQIQSMIKTKMKISSISSSDDYIFVTTRSLAGYGFDVWRTGNDFADGEVIIKSLSGCCGQMDVQCCKQGIFVAENSRDRVVHYDIDGKKITQWGKSDRTGVDGFGSCCNPMNVCFDKEGYIYTAEASLGRIKRFDATGKLVSYVGDVDLVPGCKNVSIAVSPVNDNVYMLDLTRNHIKVMFPKPAGEKDSKKDADGAKAAKKVKPKKIGSVSALSK